MPHSRSAMKRLRQNRKRRLRNKSHKSAMKTQIKKFLAALEKGDENLSAVLAATFKKIDQVAAKGIIHKKRADRIKSRLSLRMNRNLAERN